MSGEGTGPAADGGVSAGDATINAVATRVRDALASRQGAGLHDRLVGMANWLTADPAPADNAWLYASWQTASPEERQALSPLMIRTVEHALFATESDLTAGPPRRRPGRLGARSLCRRGGARSASQQGSGQQSTPHDGQQVKSALDRAKAARRSGR